MNVAVIGSGPAGLHATRALLDRGIRVTVIDTGETLPPDRQHVADTLASSDPRAWPGELVDAARRNPTIDGHGLPKKLLFGSDGPWLHPGLELYKIRLLGLSHEAEALVLGGNARRLLRAASRGVPGGRPDTRG